MHCVGTGETFGGKRAHSASQSVEKGIDSQVRGFLGCERNAASARNTPGL